MPTTKERYEHPWRRSTDQSNGRRFRIHVRDNWYRDVWLFLITGVVLYTVVTARESVEDIRQVAQENRAILARVEREAKINVAESTVRRNESCRFFERQEESTILQVQRTYRFLDGLPRDEWGSLLVRTVVKGLPDLYMEAVANRAPEYCNENGGEEALGLKEPGPQLPLRRDFEYLLRPAP